MNGIYSKKYRYKPNLNVFIYKRHNYISIFIVKIWKGGKKYRPKWKSCSFIARAPLCPPIIGVIFFCFIWAKIERGETVERNYFLLLEGSHVVHLEGAYKNLFCSCFSIYFYAIIWLWRFRSFSHLKLRPHGYSLCSIRITLQP